MSQPIKVVVVVLVVFVVVVIVMVVMVVVDSRNLPLVWPKSYQ